jgi:hypothetical protein
LLRLSTGDENMKSFLLKGRVTGCIKELNPKLTQFIGLRWIYVRRHERNGVMFLLDL